MSKGWSLFGDSDYKKFFDDNASILKRFKALVAYQQKCNQENKKDFHRKHYSRIFATCQGALDEYCRKSSLTKNYTEADQVCLIIGTLRQLSVDVPNLIKIKWAFTSLAVLFEKFLDFRTRKEIRADAIIWLFDIINACGKETPTKFFFYLNCCLDFTPFCLEEPYTVYFTNFKKHLILS